MTYAAEGKFATEEEAKADLNTCGYAGKWNKAKTAVACTPGEKLSPPAYWDAVRLHFLELGGEWLAERNPPVPADYVPSRVLPIIPVAPYYPPQKLRQG